MNKVRIAVLILIVAVAAYAAGLFIYKDIKSTGEKTGQEISKIADENQPQVKVEEISNDTPKPTIPPPDLTRKVVITAVMSEESKKQALEKIAEIIKSLKTNPDLFENWVELGAYMKLIGDYDGAVIYWKYAAVIRPKSFIPLANLGDLYLFNIKDTAKAEQSYISALMVGPDQSMVYEKLSELYRYFLKDDTKAKVALQDGINKNPSASDRLKYLLNNYDEDN